MAEVRRYLRTIRGFRSVEIVERENNGQVDNWFQGEMSLLDRFGCVITIEDDIVVANQASSASSTRALERFADDPRIFAVCGYTPPMRLEWVAQGDACLAPRYSGWGYGYWKRSLELVPRRIEDFDSVSADTAFQQRLARLGDDFLPMLQMELARTLDAGDVRMNYVMARDDLRVVIPTISLVENIGFDNTGTHCPTTQRFSVNIGRARHCNNIPSTQLTDNNIVFELLRQFRSDSHRSQPWQDYDDYRHHRQHYNPASSSGSWRRRSAIPSIEISWWEYHLFTRATSLRNDAAATHAGGAFSNTYSRRTLGDATSLLLTEAPRD